MSKQYAFAIGFDLESSSEGGGERSVAETVTLEEVGNALRQAGLPEIHSDRWDEFGQGRIFWGTQAECEAVKQVLGQFPLFVQEERNLDPGYYATPDQTYYVNELGDIYGVNRPGDAGDFTLEGITAIPLDAYRLKTVDPQLLEFVERSLQQPAIPIESPLKEPEPLVVSEPAVSPPQQPEEVSILQAQVISLTAEIEDLRMVAATHGATVSETLALRDQIALQTTQIHELERQVTVFEDQVASLEAIAAAKIDPQLHAQVQTQLQAQITQQIQQIQSLEERLAQAESQVQALQRQAESQINPQTYTQLEQQLSAQVSQSQELQQRVHRLEQQLQDAVAVAAQKIEPAKYQALEQSVADKTAQTEDFRRTIVQLQRDLQEWQTVAESKVAWSEYDAVQQELLQLKAKQKKGLFSRLFGWLLG